MLRPSFPKKMNPNVKTKMVFIWPSTWNVTAVNLPMHMNWLRLVPTAMVHERIKNVCKQIHIGKDQLLSKQLASRKLFV